VTLTDATLARSLVENLGVECAVAAKAAAFLRDRPGQVIEEREFQAAGVSASELGGLLRALRDFERRGWCRREGAGWRAIKDVPPPAVPALLQGAGAMRRSMGPEVRAEAVVTMPSGPSRLAEELPKLGIAHVGMAATSEAFLRLARSAQRTLTVASPFLNDEGVSWALALFAETPAVNRHLIVRARQATRDVLFLRHSEFHSLGVRVFDYAVPSPDGEGFETFHAKVVLADDATAYVGSANMLVHGRQPLELGIMLQGGPVPEIAAVVRAIRQVAQPIALGAPGNASASI
jgi:hypothetical protein